MGAGTMWEQAGEGGQVPNPPPPWIFPFPPSVPRYLTHLTNKKNALEEGCFPKHTLMFIHSLTHSFIQPLLVECPLCIRHNTLGVEQGIEPAGQASALLELKLW